MSVLESFLILFETNSPEVKKGTAEAKSSVDSLQNSLNRTDVVTGKVGAGFLSMSRAAVGMLGAFFGTSALINRISQAAQFSAMLKDASDSLGVSTEVLTVWGGAVKENGGSTESFIGTLKSLSAAMTQIDVTGKSRLKPFFDQLGVSLLDTAGNTRPAIDILLELSDAFQKMSKQDSTAIGRRMGLDEGTILLLQKGRREVEATLKQYKDLGEITKHDAEVADDYNDQLDRNAYLWNVISAKIGTAVLPFMTGFLKILEQIGVWIKNHDTTVVAFFMAISSIITLSLVPSLLKLLPLLFGIGGAKGAVALMSAGLWGMVAPLAAITFYFLAFEDFINYLKGNKSVFGEIQEMLEAMAPFKWLGNVISDSKQWGNYANEGSAFTSKDYIPSAGQRAAFLQSTGAVKTNNISIGNVTVQTQATDAKGIAFDIGGALNNTLNGYDDGVER